MLYKNNIMFESSNIRSTYKSLLVYIPVIQEWDILIRGSPLWDKCHLLVAWIYPHQVWEAPVQSMLVDWVMTYTMKNVYVCAVMNISLILLPNSWNFHCKSDWMQQKVQNNHGLYIPKVSWNSGLLRVLYRYPCT